jgi:molecular chaperone HscB
VTHFERLGLPERFAVNAAEVERAYLERSRALHPDFHQQSSGAEQRASMELSAALNEAYAALTQPFRRAEYLLSLLGGPSAAAHKQSAGASLEEMLDLRMRIEELRDDPDPDAPGRRKMAGQLSARSQKLIETLTQRFAQLESCTGDASRQALLVEARQTLNEAKYIQGLLRDLHAD